MNNLLKKLILSLTLASLVFTSFASYLVPSSRAAENSTWYNQGFGEFTQKVFNEDNADEIFGERYTYAQVNWILNSLAAVAIGTNVLECIGTIDTGVFDQFKSCLEALEPAEIGYGNPSTVIASSADLFLTTKPASGISYMSSVAESLHLIPEAGAQGFGFTNFEPVLPVWRASRNFAYSLLILAAIIMSFMIMFRVKISPQAVISIQSAIPKLTIAIILITFSYAIAGFLVDLSYVFLGGIAALMKTVGNEITTLNTLDLFTVFLEAHPIRAIFFTLALIVAIPFTIVGVGGGLLSGGTFALGASAVYVIVALLLAVFFLIIAIRILWTMIKAFINILLLIIAAPIILLLGIFPGAGGFGTWIKNLGGNIAVFPTISIMLFFSHYFFWGFFGADDPITEIISRIDWLNPYFINVSTLSARQLVTLPGFSGSLNAIGFFTAFGLLFLAPSVANMIKALIQGQPFNYGTAIGESVAPARTVGRAGAIYTAGTVAQHLERTGGPTTPGGAPVSPRRLAAAGTIRRVFGIK